MAIRLATLETEITVNDSKATAKILDFERTARKLSDPAKALQSDFKGAASEVGNLISLFTGDRLTGAASQLNSFAGALGALPGAAGLAFGAVAGGAVVAATAGTAIFELTKHVADYEGKIHDASIQTGLSATTLSALDVAAKQSGTTIEQVESGFAKFAKQVGAAAEGSDKAKFALKALGVDPQRALTDLDGTLDQVFRRIGAAKPGIEQTTLAQKAFGKAGADLIPLMEQAGYNVTDFKKRMEELGVTISDDAAAKADEFGDTLALLEAQLGGVARAIADPLMTEFTGMATAVSDFLRDNKQEISDWGTTSANVLRGVAGYWHDITKAVSDFQKQSRSFDQSPFGNKDAPSWWDYIKNFGMGALPGIVRRGEEEQAKVYGPYSYEMNRKDPNAKPDLGAFGGSGAIHKAPKESDSEFRKFFEERGFNVVRTFGKAINDGSPHTFGGAADISVKGKTPQQIFGLMADAIEKGYRVFDERIKQAGVTQTGPHVHFENARTTLTKASAIEGVGGFTPEMVAYLKDLDKQRLGRTPQGKFESFYKKESEKTEADQTRLNEAALEHYFQIAQLGYANAQTEAEKYYSQARDAGDVITALAAAQGVYTTEVDKADAALEEAARKVTLYKEGTIDAENASYEWARTQVTGIAAVSKAYNDLAKRRQEIWEDEVKRGQAAIDRNQSNLVLGTDTSGIIDEQKGLVATGIPVIDQMLHRIALQKEESQQLKELKGDWDSLIDTWGAAKDGSDAVMDLGRGGVALLSNMGDALDSAIEGWLLYGDSIGQALKKALAAELAHIAGASTVKAIYELAEGFAALFVDPPAAAAHFHAAALYGIAAGAAGLGAKALSGGGKAGAGSASSNSSFTTGKDTTTPYTRQANDNLYVSSRNDHFFAVSRSIDMLTNKISSMKPGDVVTAGAKAAPEAIGKANVQAMRSDSSIATDHKRVMGMGRG